MTIHALDDLSLRTRVVVAARALNGLSYGATRDQYVAALYPHDDPATARQMASRQSSCGLTCEAILRAVGVDDAALSVPYAGSLRGQRLPAVSLQVQLAHRAGAWVSTMARDPAAQGLPLDGDMVLIGGSTPGIVWRTGPGFAGEHVYTITEDGSVDGGQSDPANGGHPTAIRVVKRAWVEAPRVRELWVAGADWDGRVDSLGRPSRGKRVQGWIDVARLPRTAGALVPA